MKFLKGLNTHLAAIAGVVVAVAGFVVQPQVSPIIIPFFSPHAQQGVATALNLIGLALAYFGRPNTIKADAAQPQGAPPQ